MRVYTANKFSGDATGPKMTVFEYQRFKDFRKRTRWDLSTLINDNAVMDMG